MVDWAQQKKVGDFRLDALSTEITTMGPVVPLLSQREPVRVSSCEQNQNKQMNCTDRTLLRAESHLGGLIEYAHRHQIKGNERHAIETDSIVIFIKTLEGSHLCWTLRKGMSLQDLKQEIQAHPGIPAKAKI